MGSCGSESGTFEMLLAGPGQILEESQEDEEREGIESRKALRGQEE